MQVQENLSNGTVPNDRSGACIVLTCAGSLGDLHPYLALAQGLVGRGHRPVVATLPGHRARVEAAGLAFRPLRVMTEAEPTPELVRRVFNGRHGMEFILRKLVIPALGTAYEDTCAAAQGADLLVAHPLTLATRLVAEERGLPWVSTQLAPIGMFSAEDPPVLPGLGWLYRLHPPAAVWRALWRIADRGSRRWLRSYDALRRQLRLPYAGNPLFAGGRSPFRELAMFSPHFSVPQRDWPVGAVATGFPFFSQPPVEDPALAAWLSAGPAPVVFTLGSSAVMDPGSFFRESAKTAQRLGKRALLLGASPASGAAAKHAAAAGGLPFPVTEQLQGNADTFVARYMPYAQVFPCAAAVVHQGGIGTTSETLRAGRPMLVIPFGADQPDNAARVVRLGVGRTLQRRQYRAARVTQELNTLLEDPGYRVHASLLGAAVRAEHGVENACDALEAVLALTR